MSAQADTTEAKPDSPEVQCYDLVIVGGGLVGATLACLLNDTDLKIALVDRQAFDAANAPWTGDELHFDPRVSAITSASKRLFETLKIWSSIEAKRLQAYTHMQVWDAEGTGAINFFAKDIHALELGFIIENSVILASLYERVSELSNLDFIVPDSVIGLQQHQVTGVQHARIQLESGAVLQTPLLVAADGANSKIRELAQFDTTEWDYDHHAIVTTVKTSQPHNGCALQRFISTGPLAFLPLNALDGDQLHSSIVWSAVPERAQQLMSLDDSSFAEELTREIEGALGAVTEVSKRYSFPLRQRHATSYVKQNIALVGDAAHTIHPLAGQGVNLGLKDVEVLAAQIIKANKQGRDYYDLVVLERYQRLRLADNKGMMWLMEAFKRLFATDDLALRWLRNAGMSGIDKLSFIKNELTRQAMGLD